MNQIRFVHHRIAQSLSARVRNFALVGLSGALVVSCANGLSSGSNCSDFYRDGIKFILNVGETAQKRFFFKAGQNTTQGFPVSGIIEKILDSSIKPKTIVCKPSWSSAPEGIVTVTPNPAPNAEGEFLLALTEQARQSKQGSIVKITGKVFGAGVPAQDNIWAVVTNDAEPNDGPPGANSLPGLTTETFGELSQEDPLDWHVFKVGPRKAYQINLVSLDLGSAPLEIQGNLYRSKTTLAANEEELELIQNGINATIRTNSSAKELTVYVKIQPKDGVTLAGQGPIAYQLKSNVYVPTVGNTQPMATDDSFVLKAADGDNQPLDVLKNDSDPGGSLSKTTLAITSDPLNGTASVKVENGIGQILYSPNAGFKGKDVLYYSVKDNLDETSNEAKVLITVE
jgi:hypothetical protein